MRLDKYLSEMGIGTRSEIRKAVKSGAVTVDGIPAKDPGMHVSSDSRITYRGAAVAYREFEYYMLNKPAGIISASEDSREATVVDLIGGQKRRDLFPVGRLDRDTEGLLLITNDGDLAHRLLSPKHHVNKKYRAVVSGFVTGEDIRAFAEGLVLEDGLACLPAELTILRAGAERSETEVVIQEGKFHQIKRMFRAVGKEVLFLKRLTMGPLELDPALAPGEYRRLTEDEIKALSSK